MPRRGKVIRREVRPDAKYGSVTVARFVSRVMMQGRKATAEQIVYGALQLVSQQLNQGPVEVMEQVIKNVTPSLEVKPRRVGGATYQVPVEVQPRRGLSLAIRWLVRSARARPGKSAVDKLAAEIIDAAQGRGATVKKCEDTRRMAEANKAFAHYRW